MRRLDDARVWIGGGVVAVVLVLVAGWFLLVGPKLAQAADVRAQTAEARMANGALRTKVAGLRAQNARIPTLVGQLRTSIAQLPVTPEFAALTSQLGSKAAAAKVTLSSISISAPSTAAAAAPGASAAGSGDGEAASGATTPAPAAGSGTAGAETAGAGTSAASGIAGKLFQVPLTVTTSGTLAAQRAFLTAIQQLGSRAALVGATTVNAGAAEGGSAGPASGTGKTGASSIDGGSTMTTNLTVFVAPQTATTAAELTKLLASRPVR